MLTKFGMDDELGMVVYEENQNDITFFKPYSETTAQQIDRKIKEYLEQSYKIAKDIILDNKETLTEIAKILIEREYLSGEEFTEIIEHQEKIKKNKTKEKK
jgi:ATP-dependent Zn protease